MIATLRRYALCLVLVAVMVRGLVPVGMMPDLQALADNTLKMALCAPLSSDNQHSPGDTQTPCWFAINASFALVNFAALLLLLVVAEHLFAMRVVAVTPLRYRPSPPSRAPPIRV